MFLALFLLTVFSLWPFPSHSRPFELDTDASDGSSNWNALRKGDFDSVDRATSYFISIECHPMEITLKDKDHIFTLSLANPSEMCLEMMLILFEDHEWLKIESLFLKYNFDTLRRVRLHMDWELGQIIRAKPDMKVYETLVFKDSPSYSSPSSTSSSSSSPSSPSSSSSSSPSSSASPSPSPSPSSCPVDEEDIHFMANWLISPFIYSLEINGCPWKESHWSSFFSSLESASFSSRLRALMIRNMDLSSPEATRFLDKIPVFFPQLKGLILNHVTFPAKSFSLFDAWSEFPFLSYLDLESSRICDAQVFRLARQFMNGNFPSLKRLSLENIGGLSQMGLSVLLSKLGNSKISNLLLKGSISKDKLTNQFSLPDIIDLMSEEIIGMESLERIDLPVELFSYQSLCLEKNRLDYGLLSSFLNNVHQKRRDIHVRVDGVKPDRSKIAEKVEFSLRDPLLKILLRNLFESSLAAQELDALTRKENSEEVKAEDEEKYDSD